jgi:HD-like signal output (HDOD) protein
VVSPPAPVPKATPHRPARVPVRTHGAADAAAVSTAASATVTAESTLGTLLSRLQRKGDFPAFARAIGEVSKKADANGSFSAGQLGDSILKDYALTARLLRIVNATYARRFGGRIYSVEHAIVILGFDRVRSLALSISLFKAASAGNDSARVSESAISALISSELARNLARKARVGDDEATVCAMFKNLGRHLALVHLPEMYDRVMALVEQDGAGVNGAAKRVLGMTFEELGTAVAKSWQLPQQIVGAMSGNELPQGSLERSADRLNALAAFSTELCDVVTREGPDTRERAVRDLLVKHKNLLALDPEALATILTEIEGSLNERYASLLGSALRSSRFVANATPVATEGSEGVPELPPLPDRIRAVKVALEQGQASDAVLTLALRIVADHLGTPAPLVLTAAPNKEHLVVRFGLRDDLAGLKRELKFPLRAASARSQPFAACFHAGKDLVIKDCFAKESAETFPPSYFEVLGSPSLALYACLGKALNPALLVLEADMPEALPDPARVAELAELRPLIARAAAR